MGQVTNAPVGWDGAYYFPSVAAPGEVVLWPKGQGPPRHIQAGRFFGRKGRVLPTSLQQPGSCAKRPRLFYPFKGVRLAPPSRRT
jgi:hypothetical protein